MKQLTKLITITIPVILSAPLQAEIVDNGTYTTDTLSGLDWLDVTATYEMTYDQVNNDPTFSGWRYATRSELDTLLTHYANIIIEPGPHTTTYGESTSSTTENFTFTHKFDNIINMLGSTLDKAYQLAEGYPTYDSWFQATDPNYGSVYLYWHITFAQGLLAKDSDGTWNWGDIRSYASIINYPPITKNDTAYYWNGHVIAQSGGGSFLVRNSITAVPTSVSVPLLPQPAYLVLFGILAWIGRLNSKHRI